MDFFIKKELNGFKGDLKASEIAINSEKEQFKKQLIDKYGKEIDFVLNTKDNSKKNHKDNKGNTKSKKKGFLIRLFSLYS